MPGSNKHLNKSNKKVLLTKCLRCGGITESYSLPKKCHGCERPFLPLGYLLNKDVSEKEFWDLYVSCNELHEEDLVIGIAVLWS